MPKDDATKFRRAVARLNYLALDRPDLCVAAGKLRRCMARPREGDEKRLKECGVAATQVLHVVCSLGLGRGNCDSWSLSTSGSRRWLQGKKLKFTGLRDSATPRMY